MDDEILLTVIQIQHEQDEAVLAFHCAGGPDGDLEMGDYINRYVCRAQVRKVARWLEKHNHADVFPALSGDMLIRGSDMQALRAAAEEVRG